MKCIYCGTKLARDSQSVRAKHVRGKKHQQNVAAYWLDVGKKVGVFPPYAQLDKPRTLKDQLDQTVDLQVFRIPGLDHNAEGSLDKATLPPPVNIPTTKYPSKVIS